VTIEANNLFNDNMIFARSVLFALLLAMVFVLPQHVDIDSAKVTTLVSAVLFFWGPLGGVVGGMPAYTRAGMALQNIEALEEKLDRAMREAESLAKAEASWGGRFTGIEMQDVLFAYAPTQTVLRSLRRRQQWQRRHFIAPAHLGHTETSTANTCHCGMNTGCPLS